MMKAVRWHGSGFESLKCEDAPQPAPKAGEVLVRVRAAAVTPTEVEWYPTTHRTDGTPRPMPVILGHEFSGVVAALGPSVKEFAVGDEIYGLNDWFAEGANAEYCVARVNDIAPKPRTLDHVQAAMMPISALTAWQGLYVRANLAAGDRVLIHGGSGAVGLFAVQLAHLRRAHVIATASARNLNFVRSLGAHEALDYRAKPFEETVRDIDVVFDTVGGETFQRSRQVLKPGGKLVTIAADGEGTNDETAKAAFFIVEPNRAQLEEIAKLIDAGKIRPVVDSIFPLAEARAAYQRKPMRGKVVLRVADR